MTPEELFEGNPAGLEIFRAVQEAVAHPSPSVWMHHLELRDPDEVDAEVRGWLSDAYARAG